MDIETKFNFKSSVCTSREQSERLLALGLKKETADCVWIEISKDDWRLDANNWKEYYSIIEEGILPAWSLGRLVEDLMPQTVTYRLNDYHLSLNLGEGMIGYFPPRLSARIRALEYFYGNDTILDDCISCIEWLIKEGYFNKEYLICQKEIKKVTEYQCQYTDNIEKQEFFKNGMVIDAKLIDTNSVWIRCVDEMPPIGINVLTRVIKGDGTIIFQVDKRTEFEWVNLCHYDKVSHWMKINFLEEPKYEIGDVVYLHFSDKPMKIIGRCYDEHWRYKIEGLEDNEYWYYEKDFKNMEE